MKAKVTKAFHGRPDNAPLPRLLAEGEIVEGELALSAVAAGYAEPVSEGSAEEATTDASLDELTVDGLKAFAAERGIDLGEATKKADIRAAIDAALAAE